MIVNKEKNKGVKDQRNKKRVKEHANDHNLMKKT